MHVQGEVQVTLNGSPKRSGNEVIMDFRYGCFDPEGQRKKLRPWARASSEIKVGALKSFNK